MRLYGRVKEIEDRGEGKRLRVRVVADTWGYDESPGAFLHEIEVPNTAKARRTYTARRPVVITIKPRSHL